MREGKSATFTDQALLAVIRDGGRVHNFSDRLGLGGAARPAITRRLKKLEAQGFVHRNGGYQAVNSYFWQLAQPTSGDNEQ
jgi:DNA-binding MarR family transcriptional regulator